MLWGREVLPLEFTEGPLWEPRPSYVANAALRAEVAHEQGVASLRVAEPGRGMKFEIAVRPWRLALTPYLVLRYRARDLAGGYALWVLDSSRGGREVVSRADLVQDGHWHSLAVDLRAVGIEGAVRSLLAEVQCRRLPALLAFDWVRLAAEPPPEALVKAAPAVPGLALSAGVLQTAVARPDWLAEASPLAAAAATGDGVRLSIDGRPGTGMKWSVTLPDAADVQRCRYLVLRYRALNLAPHSDYLLWLASAPGGAAPQSRVAVWPDDLLVDGDWHDLVVPCQVGFPIRELALQARTAGGPAELEVAGIGFAWMAPMAASRAVLPEAAPAGFGAAGEASWAVCALGGAGNAVAAPLAGAFGLSDWLPPGRQVVRGVPFELAEGPGSAALLEGRGELSVPLTAAAGELFLLLGYDPPQEETAHVGRPRPLHRIREPERLRVRLEYADGRTLEAFPLRLAGGRHEVVRGMDVYALRGLPKVALSRLVVVHGTDTGMVAVVGITANAGAAQVPAPALPAALPSPPGAAAEAVPGSGWLRQEPWGFCVGNDLIEIDLGLLPGLTLRQIRSARLAASGVALSPGPLFEVGIDGERVGSDRLAVGPAAVEAAGAAQRLAVPIDGTAAGVPLRGRLLVTVGLDDGIRMELDLRNTSERALRPRLRFPILRDVRLGSVEATWYLYAQRGGIISAAPVRRREPVGGAYPLQVMSVFSPQGGALGLFTEDRDDIYRFWELCKHADGVDLSLDTWPVEVAPGAAVEVAPAILRAHGGGWRESLRRYRQWVDTWYQPVTPRQDWLRQAFYYQQTLVRNRSSKDGGGAWNLSEDIARFREAFGCLDYLHLFDAGHSDRYGRVGDYTHLDEIGGQAALREAIRGAQADGVRIGLYVEGYLCDERAAWGREAVMAACLRREDGTAKTYPNTPSEVMMCPAAPAWREHLVEVQRRWAADLQPDGLYTDQFGFGDPGKACASRQHGHPVPAAPLRGEAATMRALREAVPAGTVLLSEDVPNDVRAMAQDGALSYAVTWADPALSPHRIHLFRFLFPDFKAFQLVQYSPFTDGAWELLKYPFFNGDGIWLQGAVPGDYGDEARQFLRTAFGVLHRYAEAFTSDTVEPLVPTLLPTLYANRFGAAPVRAWTLFNAGWQTSRGPGLRVPHEPGTLYRDAFSGRPIEPEVVGGEAILPVDLGPRQVGCVVALGRGAAGR